MINVKGDLFATAVGFGGLSLLKVVSSAILTRLLYPEAYGIITMISSIGFIVEMLSDVGVVGLMVRHERGDEKVFISTMWTIRLVRGVINGAIIFLLAPVLAHAYDTPALTDSLRVFSLWFVIYGFESMAFVLAVRRRNARLQSYAELGCTAASTVFVIVFSYFRRDHFGMIYGMLFNRALMAAVSYCFYREDWPRLQFDREVWAASKGFAKYTVPASLVQLLASQYDKFIFLKLFSIQLLGLYGLAANLTGPVDALAMRISRSVLFPRVADRHRRDPATVREAYYHDNVKLVAFVLFMPAALGGSAHFIVSVLFDARYAYSAAIVQAFTLRLVAAALAGPVENMLVATGSPRPVLYGNLCRVAWLVPASLLGYYWGGFEGFMYMTVLDKIPTLLYYWWLQRRRGLLIARYELLKVAFLAAVFLSFYVAGEHLVPYAVQLRAHLKH